MTLPVERARALRGCWQFLLDCTRETVLPVDVRTVAANLLEHYPSEREIDLAAVGMAMPGGGPPWLLPDTQRAATPFLELAADRLIQAQSGKVWVSAINKRFVIDQFGGHYDVEFVATACPKVAEAISAAVTAGEAKI